MVFFPNRADGEPKSAMDDHFPYDEHMGNKVRLENQPGDSRGFPNLKMDRFRDYHRQEIIVFFLLTKAKQKHEFKTRSFVAQMDVFFWFARPLKGACDFFLYFFLWWLFWRISLSVRSKGAKS